MRFKPVSKLNIDSAVQTEAEPSPIPDLNQKPIYGILGGLGPLASTRFLNTVYSLAKGKNDQNHPRLILLSDPTYPDRSEMLLAGKEAILVERLTRDIEHLLSLNVSKIIICCYTLHIVLKQLPPELREKVLPLPELAWQEIRSKPGETLLLCTRASSQFRLFDRFCPPGTNAAQLIYPSKAYQIRIHELIYRLKEGRSFDSVRKELQSICGAYGLKQVLFGCTELHLLSTARSSDTVFDQIEVIDPMFRAAKILAK